MKDQIKCGNDYVYTIVNIENGYIDSIYEEAGRDGGYLYQRKKFGYADNGLQRRLNHIAYDYPASKYLSIQKQATKEHLLEYTDARNVIANRVRQRKQNEIKDLEAQLKRKRKELYG